MAQNGLVLQSLTTDANGQALFSGLDAYGREKTPAMYLVKSGRDLNFLPIGDYRRRYLDYSRFEVGGESTPLEPGQLSAHLFSDRGIYRPGENINLGMIVRDYAWQKNLEGVPLRLLLYDALRQIALERNLVLPQDGFSAVSYAIPDIAPVGGWKAELYLAAEPLQLLRSLPLTVQEFQPDQMRAQAAISGQKAKGWISPQDLRATLKVQNLFGTPAQNRLVRAFANLNPVLPVFAQFPGYTFSDPAQSSAETQLDLGEQETDAEGIAVFGFNLRDYKNASFQLQFIAEAFAPQGGRGVSASAQALVSPRQFLVGSKADGRLDFINRDAARTLHFIAVDSDLKSIEVKGVSLRLTEHKYVSVLTRQNSGVYKYESVPKDVQVWQEDFSIPAGGGNFRLPSDRPGRYSLALLDSQNQELHRVRFIVAGAANLTRSLARNSELELTLDKEQYEQGEEIAVAIRAPYAGSGLLTVERDKVYSSVWFKADTNNSVQRIRAPQELQGNAYINVQFVRDINSSEVFMSPLSYGVVPFKISAQARSGHIAITAPSLIKPGQILPIKLSSEEPQRVIVFAVDEGVLQVARYRLQNPLETFFAKRALEVKTSQMLDLILPEFKLLVNQAATGGGDYEQAAPMAAAQSMLARNLNPFQRKTDKAVVYWSGIVTLDGEKTLEYQVPDYFNGQLRIMAVAVRPDKIGVAQTSCLVRDDFVLLPNAPNFVAPGDKFTVSVGVSNNLEQTAALALKITASSNLEIVDGGEQTLNLAANSEGGILVNFKAQDLPGPAAISINAGWQDKSSSRTLSLSLRPATPFTTTVLSGRMEQNQISIKNLRALYDQLAQRKVFMSYSPLILLTGLGDYLFQYPHLCTEQLTSKAMAALVLARNPEIAKVMDEQAAMDMEQVISGLRSRQHRQGGFGAWLGSVKEDPFITCYVMQFLLEARQQGIDVPGTMLDAANRYLEKIAANDAYNDIQGLRMRGQALYLLARQGRINLNLLAGVLEQLQQLGGSWEQDSAAAYLACAYQSLRMEKEAARLMAAPWRQVSQHNGQWPRSGLYDSLAQAATVVYLVSRDFPEWMEQITPVVLQNLTDPLASSQFNTISAAMTMLALDGYGRVAAQSGPLTLALTSMPDMETQSSATGVLIGAFSGRTQELKLSKEADAPLWYSIIQAGFDKNPAWAASSQGLEIARVYTDKDGKPIAKVALGQEIEVHVRLRGMQGRIDNVAIVDLLPGGFEPTLNQEQGSWEYREAREDRMVIYCTATPDIQEFVYNIKAVNQGGFLTPPVWAAAMYNQDVHGNSPGGELIQVE
jgi:uncharacterized protein YfaS (alpha-2-macroglobulin family)